MKSYSGPPLRRHFVTPKVAQVPMTLGNAAAGCVRLIVWSRDCGHRVEPAPAEMASRYSPETTIPDWSKRLACSVCGSHDTDMMVTGTERR
jgi:hypothetical protein